MKKDSHIHWYPGHIAKAERQLKEKLAEDINNSQLMMCEVEVVIKELYEQVQIASEKEYRAALAQQEADNKAVEEKQEEQK